MSTPPDNRLSKNPVLIVLLVIVVVAIAGGIVARLQAPQPDEAQAAPDATAEARKIQERQAKQEQKATQEAVQALAEAEKERLEMFAGCRGDAECWNKKHFLDADLKCARLVESWAKYDYEWTDGWTEKKFDLWGWADRDVGILRYTGEQIKFQNGFGAWQRMYYVCDYNTETEQAVAVVETS